MCSPHELAHLASGSIKRKKCIQGFVNKDKSYQVHRSGNLSSPFYFGDREERERDKGVKATDVSTDCDCWQRKNRRGALLCPETNDAPCDWATSGYSAGCLTCIGYMVAYHEIFLKEKSNWREPPPAFPQKKKNKAAGLTSFIMISQLMAPSFSGTKLLKAQVTIGLGGVVIPEHQRVERWEK